MLYPFNVNFKELICKNVVFVFINFLTAPIFQLSHVLPIYLCEIEIRTNKDLVSKKKLLQIFHISIMLINEYSALQYP